jgi:hypothetical protein
VLRPARLNDGLRTGRYLAADTSAGRPPPATVLSRRDVAQMMLDTVERGTYVKDIVWVRGSRT